jgi:hypothetical protein
MGVANPDHQRSSIPVRLWLMYASLVFGWAGVPSDGTTLALKRCATISVVWGGLLPATMITPCAADEGEPPSDPSAGSARGRERSERDERAQEASGRRDAALVRLWTGAGWAQALQVVGFNKGYCFASGTAVIMALRFDNIWCYCPSSPSCDTSSSNVPIGPFWAWLTRAPSQNRWRANTCRTRPMRWPGGWRHRIPQHSNGCRDLSLPTAP